MRDDELFAELERRLRDHVDPDVTYADGALVLHRWRHDEPMDPPLRLHITPAGLGARCREMAGDAADLWDGPPILSALNLFLVHLDEVVDVGLDRAPDRRHVLTVPELALVTNPWEPDDPLPPLQLPALDPGETYTWSAYASGPAETSPPEGTS